MQCLGGTIMEDGHAMRGALSNQIEHNTAKGMHNMNEPDDLFECAWNLPRQSCQIHIDGRQQSHSPD